MSLSPLLGSQRAGDPPKPASRPRTRMRPRRSAGRLTIRRKEARRGAGGSARPALLDAQPPEAGKHPEPPPYALAQGLQVSLTELWIFGVLTGIGEGHGEYAPL